MKRVSLIALSLVLVAGFAMTVSAQPPAAATPVKVVWIDSGAFGDDKQGITRYVQAAKAIDTEMAPKTTELKGIQTRLQTLSTDIENLQKQLSSNAPIDKNAIQKQIQDKTDEGQNLQRDFEYKQKAAQAAYTKRAGEVLNPISQQIMLAMKDYAKQKGFTVILDIAAMIGDQQSPGQILYLDPSADVTKDFVTYFNARPATTATATKPQ